MQNDPQPFVDVTTAARALDVSPYTIRHWIKLGYMPAMRYGAKGSWRIPVSALNDNDPSRRTQVVARSIHAEVGGEDAIAE